MKPPRVVLSYTTLPSRYDVLRLSLDSISQQTRAPDAIYLTLPEKTKRRGQSYPPLPPAIEQQCRVVRSPIDYGPMTKIYGALTQEHDPETVIISCDDDVVFPANFIEIMLGYHCRYPNVAITGTGALLGHGLRFISIISSIEPFPSWSSFTGFPVGPEGRAVDLVFGVAGVLYTRGMFTEDIWHYPLLDDDLFCNDDVIISGYLSKHGIKRWLFPNLPSVTHVNGPDALSADLWLMIERLERALKKSQQHGLFPHWEPLAVEETPYARSAYTIVAVLFLALAIWGCWAGWTV